jgi:excisionase family DNA binding protein
MDTPQSSKTLAGGIVAGLFLPEVSQVADLERILRLDRDLLVEELASGRLHGRRIGDRWLVHRDAVKAWLNVYAEARHAE